METVGAMPAALLIGADRAARESRSPASRAPAPARLCDSRAGCRTALPYRRAAQYPGRRSASSPECAGPSAGRLSALNSTSPPRSQPCSAAAAAAPRVKARTAHLRVYARDERPWRGTAPPARPLSLQLQPQGFRTRANTSPTSKAGCTPTAVLTVQNSTARVAHPRSPLNGPCPTQVR